MSKNTITSTREKNVPFEYENAYEEWSTAGIGNTFLFGKVMTSNPNLLLELLQYSLPEFHIQQIENPEKEADVKLSMDAHGVRLDVITTDDQGRRIDVEMQMRDEKNIPRRMRYYEGSIDQATLEKGQNYNRLGDVVILFITPFDPFDAHGYYKYTFRNTCQEDKEIVLDDGVTKVLLNAAGHKGDIKSELKEFLQLVAGNVDSTHYAEGSFAERVQRQVHIARRNARWRKEYMDWEMTLRNEREKGREEGREEGLKEGREEGRMEERIKTEEQRKRAEAAEERADVAEERIRKLEEQIALLEKGNH
ncbi:MAG: Rpn family recombination-promoting nuclease/putative transposase [Lachnospiraceae bacterium]|nr:Rpn family recombination-promoting nuclease/putative transposase [Lachnospiraceae bacterium]